MVDNSREVKLVENRIAYLEAELRLELKQHEKRRQKLVKEIAERQMALAALSIVIT